MLFRKSVKSQHVRSCLALLQRSFNTLRELIDHLSDIRILHLRLHRVERFHEPGRVDAVRALFFLALGREVGGEGVDEQAQFVSRVFGLIFFAVETLSHAGHADCRFNALVEPRLWQNAVAGHDAQQDHSGTRFVLQSRSAAIGQGAHSLAAQGAVAVDLVERRVEGKFLRFGDEL